jgi:7-cyano-7-deazaguanine synthase in queuosine biosynthesis
MKLVCAPESFPFAADPDTLNVVLYGQPGAPDRGSAGAAAKYDIVRAKLDPAPRAWDLLSIALSVVTADLAGLREHSADGWTRDFELDVAVVDAAFWNAQSGAITAALDFLTTDRWQIHFTEGGLLPSPPRHPVHPDEDCVVLLSGGLDSLVGVIDLVEQDRKPLAVSQTVRGDAEKQTEFARRLGARHLQLNHNATPPGTEESTQRARSFIFIAFGVLAATSLARYHAGERVTLYICENGLIALNPPLTGARIGSLSTRTAHPEFFSRIQHLLDAAGLKVQLENPYKFKTKGEMLTECADQDFLKSVAASSTSCGRFQRFNYMHCGRCLPCQVRRAAFLVWGQPDATKYVYDQLGKNDDQHAGFDDVRSAAMAIEEIRTAGLDSWLGSSLGTPHISDSRSFKELIRRGMAEIGNLHAKYGVK